MLELELNSSGTLTFEIPPNHYYYDNIKKRKSIIKVFQDDELIFFGTPLDDFSQDNLIKKITVEGALSWLNDTIQPYGEYHDITLENYLQTLITNHNNMVSLFKQFTLGAVTVTDSNDSLYRYTNFEKTKDCISDDLISPLGGYIKAKHENGVNYINYTASSGSVNTQGVRFGFNLISCTKDLKSSTTATAIIPLGAKLSEDSDERLTIADVNDGVIYVYDEESVSEFDWIYVTVIYDDVTTASALMTKGYSELATRKYLSGSYTINAIDMSLLDGNYSAIRIGDYIPIVSEKHGVDDYMTVSKMSIDLCDPTQSTLTIGSEFTTLTDSTRYSDKVINTVVKNYVKNETVTEIKSVVESNTSLINQTASDILLNVSQNYVTTGTFSEFTELNETNISQTASEVLVSAKSYTDGQIVAKSSIYTEPPANYVINDLLIPTKNYYGTSNTLEKGIYYVAISDGSGYDPIKLLTSDGKEIYTSNGKQLCAFNLNFNHWKKIDVYATEEYTESSIQLNSEQLLVNMQNGALQSDVEFKADEFNVYNANLNVYSESKADGGGTKVFGIDDDTGDIIYTGTISDGTGHFSIKIGAHDYLNSSGQTINDSALVMYYNNQYMGLITTDYTGDVVIVGSDAVRLRYAGDTGKYIDVTETYASIHFGTNHYMNITEILTSIVNGLSYMQLESDGSIFLVSDNMHVLEKSVDLNHLVLKNDSEDYMYIGDAYSRLRHGNSNVYVYDDYINIAGTLKNNGDILKQTGTVIISSGGSGVVNSTIITFDTPFISVPRISVIGSNNAWPETSTYVSVSSVTINGFTINWQSTGIDARTFSWIAIAS